MPDQVKAELIGGIVYMPAALRRRHGRHHGLLVHWLYEYEEHTPGVEAYDNTTTIMAEDSEPQPDASLIILPECGGQMTFTEDDYLQGAPELAVEVATSTESYDLHNKKRDYERAGVREYLVVAARQRKVFWFRNRGGKFRNMKTSPDGIFRSTVFHGLWLDAEALLGNQSPRVMEVLRQGMATAEHAKFVKRLGSQKKSG
jgi:Uma2 family endonuclease